MQSIACQSVTLLLRVARSVAARAAGIALGLMLCGTAVAATPPPSANTAVLDFARLGVQGMELKGLRNLGYANFGIRRDEVVTRARLRLRLTWSPSLLSEMSHLRVHLNNQLAGVITLPREQAGHEIEREIELDPRYFTDYNQLRVEFIGHYTQQCEDLSNTSIWLSISPQSTLELTKQPLELRNDLALLPAPFFDRRSNQRVELPVLLPTQPSLGLLHAVGVAASWFGMLADYRSARFPVTDALPKQHALVFATNNAQPAGLKLQPVDAPTLLLMDNPQNRNLKLLVFQGRDDAQLEQAVTALVLGNPVFSGDRVTVKGVTLQPRPAYDAPRWLHSDRPMKLGELVDAASQLQTEGMAPDAINVNLRLPPDLFTWNRNGVPVNLRYRFTAPKDVDNSLLNISVNQQLLRSFRLKPDTDGGTVRVPLLANDNTQRREDLLIPAFQLASNNQLQFRFALDYHHDGLCREVFNDATREAIDPDSSIDISDFAHYTAMPNLALFANAGYPFTRFADLSQTAVVIPDTQPATIEQLLFVLGRMGRHTGAVATRYQLLTAEQAQQATAHDVLLISGARTQTLLNEWQQTPALRLQQGERLWSDSATAPAFDSDPLRLRTLVTSGNSVDVNVNGSLAALISFESPLSSGRTVVAFTASDATAGGTLLNALEDDGKVAVMRGDLILVRGNEVQSYQNGNVYYVGSLAWWLWLWFHISRHPVLLTLLALTLAVVTALLAYGWLQRRHQQRMATTESVAKS